MSRKPIELQNFPSVLCAGYGPYRAVVKHVVDGDTFDVLADPGFNNYPYLTLRLDGVNAPEINTPEGKDARDYLRLLMYPGRPVVIFTKPYPVTFGRYAARVQFEINGQLFDLGEHLVLAGYAKFA